MKKTLTLLTLLILVGVGCVSKEGGVDNRQTANQEVGSSTSFVDYQTGGDYYINQEMGFKIKIPKNWVVRQYKNITAGVGFCELSCGPGGPDLLITTYDNAELDIEGVISQIGNQFSKGERHEKRENIKIGGLDALSVVVTTSAKNIVPGWVSQHVVLQKDKKIYDLSGVNSNVFYKTFEFIN